MVDVKKGIKSDTYAKMKKTVLEKAEKEGWFDVPHHNADTNSLIFLTEDSFSHAFNNLTRNFGEDTIRCMAHIPEIIREAILVNVSDPKDSRKLENKVYTFLGVVDGINNREPVKLTVKGFGVSEAAMIPQNIKAYFEKNGFDKEYNKLYDVEALEVIGIEKIKEEPDASGKVGRTSLRARATSDSSKVSVAELLELVNGDARKYIPKPVQNSDRNNTSVHDRLGQGEDLKKQNAKLEEDVARLKERLKLERQVTKGNTFNEKQLGAVARHLRHLVGSTYDMPTLVNELKEVYSYIVQTPQLDWMDVMAMCQEVARNLLDNSKGEKVTNDYFKDVLTEIRKARIKLNEGQIQEAKNAYGEKYRDAFMGRIMLTNDGVSLDQQWKEWSSMYPEIFDASISLD